MLQHNPNERPSALQLSQSPLLPPRIEDEYFKEALQMMSESIISSRGNLILKDTQRNPILLIIKL